MRSAPLSVFAVVAAACCVIAGCSSSGGSSSTTDGGSTTTSAPADDGSATGQQSSVSSPTSPATILDSVSQLTSQCQTAEQNLPGTYMCVSTGAVNTNGNDDQNSATHSVGDSATPLCNQLTPKASGITLKLGTAGIGATQGDPNGVLFCYWQYTGGTLELTAFQMPSYRTAESCVDGIASATSFPDGSYGAIQPDSDSSLDDYGRCFSDSYQVSLVVSPPNGPFSKNYADITGTTYSKITGK